MQETRRVGGDALGYSFLKKVLKAFFKRSFRPKMQCSSLGTPSEAGWLALCVQLERLIGCSSPCCAGVQSILSLAMDASASKLRRRGWTRILFKTRRHFGRRVSQVLLIVHQRL
jgi:hypothetical protein